MMDIGTIVATLKWKWAGHVSGRHDWFLSVDLEWTADVPADHQGDGVMTL